MKEDFCKYKSSSNFVTHYFGDRFKNVINENLNSWVPIKFRRGKQVSFSTPLENIGLNAEFFKVLLVFAIFYINVSLIKFVSQTFGLV